MARGEATNRDRQDRWQLTDHLAPRPGRVVNPEPRSARVILSAALLGLFLVLGWIIWSAGRNHRFDGRGGLSPQLKISRDVPPGGRFLGDPYVGPRVCAECHPGEYALFTGSGHALTMRMASERRLSDRLAGRTVTDPERPDVRWTYAKQKGEFFIERQETRKNRTIRGRLCARVGSSCDDFRDCSGP